MRLLWRLLISVSVIPVFCSADSFYQYTINFGPTAGSESTSVSYFSDGLMTTPMDLVPGQVTVISAPASDATQHPGLGSEFVALRRNL